MALGARSSQVGSFYVLPSIGKDGLGIPICDERCLRHGLVFTCVVCHLPRGDDIQHVLTEQTMTVRAFISSTIGQFLLCTVLAGATMDNDSLGLQLGDSGNKQIKKLPISISAFLAFRYKLDRNFKQG